MARTVIESRAAQFADGKAARQKCPRTSHARLDARHANHDLACLIQRDNQGRLPDLLPVRYARMAASAFAFFRGSVAVMTDDLASLPDSGVMVQLCGDCHLGNFSGFASAERTLLFGIDDFDETCRGPFEWDLKRLAASFAVFAIERGMSRSVSREIAERVAGSYRERLALNSEMRTTDIWNARIEARSLLDAIESRALRAQVRKSLDTENRREHQGDAGGIVKFAGGNAGIVDRPPLIYHLPEVRHFEGRVRRFLGEYLKSLPPERRPLVERYRVHDIAAKVTGVGSVGSRCAIALLMDDANEVLLLQIKEARRPVIERYLRGKRFSSQGLRVVAGQHLLKAGDDVFLGWFRSAELGRDFYVRRYKDTGFAIDLGACSARGLEGYGRICGWELARAHAKAGAAAAISGYIGKSRAFETAIGRFAVAYAQRNLDDYAEFMRAIESGRLVADPAVDEKKQPRSGD